MHAISCSQMKNYVGGRGPPAGALLISPATASVLCSRGLRAVSSCLSAPRTPGAHTTHSITHTLLPRPGLSGTPCPFLACLLPPPQPGAHSPGHTQGQASNSPTSEQTLSLFLQLSLPQCQELLTKFPFVSSQLSAVPAWLQ